jgi:orotidine-5'-phosphate decarboxylase
MGSDSVLPFTEKAEKGIFILCKTSNPSATEVLDLRTESGKPVWKHLVELAVEKWNANKNAGFVLSANSHKDLIGVRQVIGESPILLAGVGVQGGNLADSIHHIMDSRGYGFLVPSSRGVIFAPPNEGEPFSLAIEKAARKLRDDINRFVGH